MKYPFCINPSELILIFLFSHVEYSCKDALCVSFTFIVAHQNILCASFSVTCSLRKFSNLPCYTVVFHNEFFFNTVPFLYSYAVKAH